MSPTSTSMESSSKTPISTTSWTKLERLAKNKPVLKELFAKEAESPSRFAKFHVKTEKLLYDYSKTHLTDESRQALIELAKEMQVEKWRDDMFAGKHVNVTEDRAALHTALRAALFDSDVLVVDGQDVYGDVKKELERMRQLSDAVRNGAWKGATGKPITDIVNIGIGGSDLGPAMACTALWPYIKQGLAVHFVSNVDGADVGKVLSSSINLESTLFIIVSKTFTTAETMRNAQTARAEVLKMLSRHGHDEASLKHHFVAVSSNIEAVKTFGIESTVQFWDWVGGRYSVWSAVGLSVMVSIGYEQFVEFLRGAYDIDRHFAEKPMEQNIPILMALVGVWYRNFLSFSTHAVLPYEQSLCRFPAYLQQLEMESNGKSTTREGQRVVWDTCPIVWGEPGTNGQHAFFQLLHQGTEAVACDFLVGRKPVDGVGSEHHNMLVANCLAQCEALMVGRQSATDNHKHFEGNRPSSLLLYDCLNPYTLGMLIALYEHKVAVQGWIWNINSFDQMGVELGKVLATGILKEVQNKSNEGQHDASTNALINFYLKGQF